MVIPLNFIKTNQNEQPQKLLTRVLYEWGKRTVLELGVEGQSREFISVAGVQEHLSMIWRGNISSLGLSSLFSQFLF